MDVRDPMTDLLDTKLTEIGVVITAFERLGHTLATIQGLLETGLHPDQIVLADGGSKAATLVELKQRLPAINLLGSMANLWWTEGMNVGLEFLLQKPYAFILLLN